LTGLGFRKRVDIALNLKGKDHGRATEKALTQITIAGDARLGALIRISIG
jgi:hypothetical protein